MPGFDVSYVTALTAGILTFLSPCILPLVPAYLCFISGLSLEQLTGGAATRPGANGTAALDDGAVDAGRAARTAFLPGLAFVIGLSTVFILMGAAASSLGQLVSQYKRELAFAGGLVIILFGIHYMGLLRIGFLNFEKRMHLENKPAGLIGAFIIGLAFGFGWTPCVGPVLSTILMIAATGESAWSGVGLLGTFAAGLGIPFLLAALAAGPFMRFMARFRRHMRKVEIAMGSLLVVTGLLIVTGGYIEVQGWLLDTFPALGTLN